MNKLPKKSLNSAKFLTNFKLCDEFIELVFRHNDTIAEAQDSISGLPNGKCYEDKYSIAIYNNQDQIIAVCDLIEDHSRKDSWYIGLLLLSPTLRQQGLGSFIYSKLEKVMISLSGQEVHLITQDNNPKATNFWKKHDFEVFKKTIQPLEFGRNIVHHLKKYYSTPLIIFRWA